MSNPATLDEVKTALTQYKADVEARIDGKVKEQTDAASAEIKTLKETLAGVTKSLAALEEQSKKPFGLPGVEAYKDKWSWTKFFKAMYLSAAGGKGSVACYSDPWGAADAGLEKEVCEQYAKRQAVEFGKAMLNMGVKDYNQTDGSQGGFLVAPEIYAGDIIEPTYAQTPILSMPGIMKLSGLRGDLPVPVDNGNLTAYHVGENTKPTKTDSQVKLTWLRPKKIGTFVKVSNRLVSFATPAMDTFIKNKMARDTSIELSRGLTVGKGSEYEPMGLLNSINTAAMTAAVAIGASGGRFTIDKLASMKMALAAVNELRDTPTYGALMHPNVLWGMLRERVMQYATAPVGGQSPILPGMLLLNQSDIEAAVKATLGATTQIAATDTKGTSSTCSKVVYGDFSKFIYATFRDPIFKVSDVAGDGSTGSAFLDDQLYMVMFMEYDCQVLRAAAFAYLADAETSEANW